MQISYKNGEQMDLKNPLFWGMLLIGAGLAWSNFLASNGTILLAFSIFFSLNSKWPFIDFNQQGLYQIQHIQKPGLFLAMLAVFFGIFVSGLWSDELADWYKFSRMNLPFLVLPIAFMTLPALGNKEVRILILIVISVLLITSFKILLIYYNQFHEINKEILQGHHFPTPISHIRYSLLLAICILVLLDWVLHKYYFHFKFEKALYIFLLIYLFLFIHLLSVKSGLVGLYLALTIYIFLYFRERGKIVYAFGGIISMFIILLACVYFIPSLNKKYLYSIWQLGEFTRGKWLLYSDLERWVSMKIGWQTIQQHMLLGTGIGDLDTTIKTNYQNTLQHADYKLPHNQFLFSWAACGIPGLISIIGLVYYGIVLPKFKEHKLLIAVQAILLSSFLFEYTLGTQLGIAIYLFFTLLLFVEKQKLKIS